MSEGENPLARPLHVLWGVGPERARQLARLDLHTVGDLLFHAPRRYEDRRRLVKISGLELGQAVTTHGKIVACGLKKFRGGRKSIFEIILEDGSGRLHVRWWNLPFMEKFFKVGDEVFVYGKVLSLKPRTIDHPETEIVEGGEESSIHLHRIAPIYPLTEGVMQRWLRGLLWRTLAEYEPLIPEVYPDIPRPDLPARANAVHMLHFPEELPDIEIARQRLALDEFIGLQIAIQTRRRKLEAKAKALPCGGTNELTRPFLAGIGFELTSAQTRVLKEIRADMRGKYPMRRLLQGDVGSGKTVVAACTALMALESGFSVALMAPTEILAEQHFRNFRRWLEPLGIAVELLTGSVKTVSDFAATPTLFTPRPAGGKKAAATVLYIGTHALVAEKFTPPNLGLVIIDEQHKFGVGQRETLLRKGNYPHLLVMTATPIPRTLGLTIYGDLDISVIDGLPPGRGGIKTYVRTVEKLPKVMAFIREKLEAGRQAYVVYPRVEDDGTGEVKAVTKEFEKLRTAFAPHRVGLLHGRLKPEEKEQTMAAFRLGQIKVLLATSVIEVGVDVANASIMLIENAELFGLAQLHQLRGRIGRGEHDSYCILMAAAEKDEAWDRLKIMEETNDGFRIAEEDLRLRGPGELLGQNQSGLPDLRFGNLRFDRPLVERARTLASDYLDKVGEGKEGNSKSQIANSK